MNYKNLAMWGIIVLLTLGLYNMFKNPQSSMKQSNNIIFSEFLTEVDNGRVVQVEIQGKKIKGVMSNGKTFNTYAPDDPNLIQKLSEKGVSISASPLEEKNAIIIRCSFVLVPNASFNCCLDLFYETNAGRQRWCHGIWKIKS